MKLRNVTAVAYVRLKVAESILNYLKLAESILNYLKLTETRCCLLKVSETNGQSIRVSTSCRLNRGAVSVQALQACKITVGALAKKLR